MTIQKVTVVGAGIMGAGIAQVCAGGDFAVTLVDVAQETLGRGIESIASSLQQAVSKGAISRADMQRTLGNISTAVGSEKAVSKADLIIEAVPENIELIQIHLTHYIRIKFGIAFDKMINGEIIKSHLRSPFLR